MKVFYLISIFSLFSIHVQAYEFPYETLDGSYKDTTIPIEISPSTPIKAQDGIGLCYGFSATSLLESYRCRELKLNCDDPKEFLSSLDVTSYYERKSLKEGGDTYRIFSNIENSKRKIAKEECVQFSALVHQMVDYKNIMQKDEKRGWIFLVKKWNEYRGIGKDVRRNDCVACLADEIKKNLPNVQTPIDQLKDAFTSSHSMEEFLYKSLLPAQCMEENKMASIPEFKSKSYPGYNEKADANAVAKKVESLLLSSIPVEISICTQKDFTDKCTAQSAHSIALFGIKQVCSSRKNDCRTMVKVKNSYGNTWQLQNNNGWVNLKSLADSSFLLTQNNNISWIEKPGFILIEKSLSKKSVTSLMSTVNSRAGGGIPDEYKNYYGIWKCPGTKYVDQYEPGCIPLK